MHFCLRTLLLCAVVAVATPAFAAKCYVVILMDAKGEVIITKDSVIGLEVGGNPVIEGNFPAHASRKRGAAAECPPQLVLNLTNLFNSQCTSEERRAKAAADNRVDAQTINKGCGNMANALAAEPDKRN